MAKKAAQNDADTDQKPSKTDDIMLALIVSMVSNRAMYQGFAEDDYKVIQTAKRLRRALFDAGLLPPVNA